VTRLIGLIRYIIIVAVLATLIAATALILFGTVETYVVIRDVFSKGEFTSKVAKALLLSFIEITDIFLLATVLYIVALGLYELFIDHQVGYRSAQLLSRSEKQKGQRPGQRIDGAGHACGYHCASRRRHRTGSGC
jgi:uncharacterized membrane protein YqhA